jgi:hypothetical protein
VFFLFSSLFAFFNVIEKLPRVSNQRTVRLLDRIPANDCRLVNIIGDNLFGNKAANTPSTLGTAHQSRR